MKKDFSRLVAYFLVPLIFTLAGVGVAYVAFNGTITNMSAQFAGIKGEGVPEFQKAEVPQQVEVRKADLPVYGAFYANVYIDRFNYASKIYYGNSVRLMKKAICQEFGGALPGFGGKTILTADTHGAFWVLEDIEAGDTITIDTAYGEYEYEVVDSKIGYASEDVDAITSDEEILVMYGELPFKSNHKTVMEEVEADVDGTHKIVWAKKISGPDASFEEGA